MFINWIPLLVSRLQMHLTQWPIVQAFTVISIIIFCCSVSVLRIQLAWASVCCCFFRSSLYKISRCADVHHKWCMHDCKCTYRYVIQHLYNVAANTKLSHKISSWFTLQTIFYVNLGHHHLSFFLSFIHFHRNIALQFYGSLRQYAFFCCFAHGNLQKYTIK